MALAARPELTVDVLVTIAGRLSTSDVFNLIFCSKGTLAISQTLLAGRRIACSTPSAVLASEPLKKCLRLLGRQACQVQDPQLLAGASVENLAVLREWGLTLADICDQGRAAAEWDADLNAAQLCGLRDPVAIDPRPPRTFLERVVYGGHADLLRELGRWGLTPHQVRAHDNWVLRAAARHGHVGLLRVLGEWGLTATDARARENCALRMAAANGHVAVLELFRDWGLGAEDAAARGHELLWWAVQRGHVGVLRVLVTWGVGAAQFRANENGLLCLAASLGRVQVLELLREVGMTTEDARANDNTPLQLAVRHGHVETMQLLRSWGLTLADARTYNNALLVQAAISGNVAVLRVLREWGLTPAEAKQVVVVAIFYKNAAAAQFLREWSSPAWRRFLSWLFVQ